MDLIEINRAIYERILLLQSLRGEMESKIVKKVNFSAAYDKELAIVLVKLRNGVAFEIDGYKIQNPAVSIMEKIAKGLCWKAGLNKDQSDAEYKALISKMDSIKIEINGLQSMKKNPEDLVGM